jgi:hypothetical protein
MGKPFRKTVPSDLRSLIGSGCGGEMPPAEEIYEHATLKVWPGEYPASSMTEEEYRDGKSG